MTNHHDIRGYDLLALAGQYTALRWSASTRGGEYKGACPQCGGRDRLIVQPTGGRDGRGQWTCRSCREFRWGDAEDFVLWQGLAADFRGACATLKLDIADRDERIIEPPPPEPCDPPSDEWQARALEVATQARERLWTDEGARARSWLAARGFSETTMRGARLGYHPADTFDAPEAWGLPAQHAKVYTPRGVVIPWFIDGAIWRLNVRRPLTPEQIAAGEAKYRGPAGSSNALYGGGRLASTLPAVIVEGELDALSVWQEARDVIAPVALGSTSGARRVRWIARLSLCPVVLVATDNEEPGERAARYWLDVLGPIARRWRPTLKDCNAMLQAGMSLREWAQVGLEVRP